MKVIVEVAGERRTVEVKRDGTRLHAEIDERRYELSVDQLQPELYQLTSNNRTHECRIDAALVRRGTAEVMIDNQTYTVHVFNPKRLRSGGGGTEHTGGRVSLHAAMPGKIVRVLVEQGEEVTAGQGLIVVEAMKMQNEMKSPKDGRVTEIHFSTGDTVGAGDALVTVE